MAEHLNLGVVGLGRMGRLYARTIAMQVAGVQLYAVAEPDAQARAVVVEAFPVPHVFADAAELVPHGDAEALARGVVGLLGDRELREGLAAAGLVQAAGWQTEDDTIAHVLSVYDELAQP